MVLFYLYKNDLSLNCEYFSFQSRDVDRNKVVAVKEANMYYFIESGMTSVYYSQLKSF